jgi:hypothetical protein
LCASRRSKAITCCRAFEAIYSTSSAAKEARAAFEAAAALAGNWREHDLLRRHAAEAVDAAMSS